MRNFFSIIGCLAFLAGSILLALILPKKRASVREAIANRLCLADED